jgi:signal peptide peptidase SppA
MDQLSTELWLGSEASAAKYLEYVKLATTPEFIAKMQADLRAASSDTQEDQHYLLSIHEGVGIIDIKGSLISNGDEYSRYYGLVSYPEIRDALIEAAQNPDIKTILLNLDTHGGSANGVDNVSSTIDKINKEFKPVDAFTGGTMASAGYWIGSSARRVYSTRMASVGSIGVISIHFDQTKMMEGMGIKPTVFRAGQFKALGNPYEALDEKTTKVIQDRIDTLYDEFINHIALSRNASTTTVREKMAEGRDFFGFEALQVGMVDGITTLDDLVSKLISQNQHAGVTSSSVRYKMEVNDMAKKTSILTEQDVALLAAGVPQEQLGDVEQPATEPADSDEAAPTPATTEVTATLLQTGDSELVSFLRSELTAARSESTKLAVENASLQTKLADLEGVSAQFRSMAEDVINVRSVALRRGSVDLKTASNNALVEMYSQITKDFHKAFPVGGKAQMPDTKPTHEVSHVARAAAQASKI